MASKDRPMTWVAPRGSGGDEGARQRLAGALEQGAKAGPGQGSLAKKRQESARRYARDILRGLAATPALKTGQAVAPEDVRRIVNDYISDENIPPSVRGEVARVGLEMLEHVASGQRGRADETARLASFAIGEQLARSAWDGSRGGDMDEAREVADRIRR